MPFWKKNIPSEKNETKCSTCGRSSPPAYRCIVCGKVGCLKCNDSYFLLALKARNEPDTVDAIKARFYACSKECYSTFEKEIRDIVPLSTVGTSDTYFTVENPKDFVRGGIFSRACYKILEKHGAKYVNGVNARNYQVWMRDFLGNKSVLLNNYYYDLLVALAGNIEKAGRAEDAAEIYEHLGKYDEARQCREKDRRIVVKEVSVNLNSLLQQIKEGGIVVVYRCPHCGAPLKVGKNTQVEQLSKCEHCNSEIESMDIAEFLRTALS